MYKSKKLFGSGSRVKILKLFFAGNPEVEFYGREMSRRTGIQMHAIRRELQNLEQLGILKCRMEQRKIMYRLNLKNGKIVALRSLII